MMIMKIAQIGATQEPIARIFETRTNKHDDDYYDFHKALRRTKPGVPSTDYRNILTYWRV